MSKRIFTAVGVAAALAVFSSFAAADNIVAPGSSYSFRMQGEVSGQAFTGTGVFDGLPQGFTRAGLSLSLTESQTDLGGGMFRINVNITANGDLFPSPGEGAIDGLGVNGNGLDLLQPVFLDDARISFSSANGVYFTTSNLANDYRSELFSGPWDGGFITGESFINGNIGGRGTTGVAYEFDVSVIPEPETYAMLLAGIGLLGFIARRRQNSLARFAV